MMKRAARKQNNTYKAENRMHNVEIIKFNTEGHSNKDDKVAIEEPLEISLSYFEEETLVTKNISVTMRTPGNDQFLAIGFLFTESIINNASAVQYANHFDTETNRINVGLHKNAKPFLQNTERNFYTTSSCGVCGKASIDAIKTVSQFKDATDSLFINNEVLYTLPQKLREQQVIFESTGGLHAASLFNNSGDFLMLQEDVGRHNALDKLIGEALMKEMLPLNNSILLLSGRASFELIQKATMAGIKMVVAIGAPSSLAVQLAEESNITLVGFLKKESFNVYAGKQRIG